MLRKAIICDIDGCLLDTSKIDKHCEGMLSKEFWEFFETHANDANYSKKNKNVFDLVNLYYQEEYEIILLTARSKRIAKQTYFYLTEGKIRLPKEILLVCRDENEDGIADVDIKQRRLTKLLEDYDIRIAIDDREENCVLFARNNILAMQVTNVKI